MKGKIMTNATETMKNEINDKSESLAKYLGTSISEIVLSNPDECLFEFEDREYLVCTEEESIKKAYDYVENSLWAFNAKFLVKYMPSIHFFNEREEKSLIECLKTIQEKMSEDCNQIILTLVGTRIDALFNEAVRCDGMGHFLNTYDGKEHQEGDFFIYRIN
jgi:hypothetical protein